ncbi:TonB-dependent receptor plug domain-containing protein [Methylocystis sp. S23]
MRNALLIGLAAALSLSAVEASAGQRVRRASPAQTDDYFAEDVTGPSGTKTPAAQVPTSVITRKMMDDVQARSLCDALRLAPGVSTGGCR